MLIFIRNIILAVSLFISLFLVAFSPVGFLPTVVFSVIFNLILYFALNNLSRYPGLSIFSLLVWLGLFLKTTCFVVLGRGLKDPTGLFKGTDLQWHDLFYVSILGGLAILSAFYFSGMFAQKSDVPKSDLQRRGLAPDLKISHSLLVGFLFVLLCVTSLNLFFGITLSGLAAVTHLPFKLNAMSGWMLYLGFTLSLSVLLLLSLRDKKYFNICLLLVFVEGFLCSVSIISRGLYVFHVLPTVALLIVNRQTLQISYQKIAGLLVAFVVGLFLTVGTVTQFRQFLFSRYAFDSQSYSISFDNIFQSNRATLGTDTVFGQTWGVLSDLFVSRWVGAEGLMSTVSYEDKSLGLLLDSLIRVPKAGEQDIFAKISGFAYAENSKISFAFIPGPFALFYYSGNLFVVFAGIFGLCLFLFVWDEFVWRLFKNPFLSYQIAVYLGVNAAQFGLSPLPLVKALVMTATGLVLLKSVINFEVFPAKVTHLWLSLKYKLSKS